MPQNASCARCGKPLDAELPGGLCSACALTLAIEVGDAAATQQATDPNDIASPPTATVVVPLAEGPGSIIGRYKLLQKIGEGGCGVVYMAEQEEPVHRRVALKVIKLGMDTKEVIARFEAERQALALMDHPNIAKVFDAGSTETGRPYFVMELVRGIRITQFCDQHNLSTRERLDLFTKVCQAIQHAHQKGIIHRDIKPSNVLVASHDGVPVPKVIDFGIAKATGGRLTNKTYFTALEQFIGTPAYMSPEQAELSGLDIDTRTDIYSLGVLLYELLTGRPPFDPKELAQAGLDEIRRIIREEEPPKPSTRLTSELVAADVRRRTSKSEVRTPKSEEDSASSRRQLQEKKELIQLGRGDLDWIVMKCLEKDRARRYETANGLAMDLKRHLDQEPVVARPPNTAYRIQKFVRRNKGAVTAAAAVAGVLVLGVMVSTWEAVRATRAERAQSQLRTLADQHVSAEAKQRERAEQEARRAQAALTRVEIERAESLFSSDNSSLALASLARLLRQQPTNGVVAERVMSALSHRSFCLPAAQPLRHGRPMMSPVYPKSDAGSSITSYVRQGGSIRAANFSPDSQRVVTASKDGTAHVWDSRTGLPLAGPLKHQAEVMWAQFNADGQRVVTASLDKSAQVWDAESGQAKARPLHHEGGVLFAAFSPDGHKVVTASLDKAVRVWDAETGQLLSPPITHGASVYFASFTADGSRLLTASTESLAQLWNSGTGKKIASFSHGMQIESLLPFPHLSFDEKQIATTRGNAAAIWDAATRKAVAPLNHDNALFSVRFSPDGTVAAIASIDNTARVWDAANGMPVTQPIRHENWVVSAQFDPAGQRLVTTSRDNTARIWDALTGGALTEPLRHDSRVRFAQFSPDGQRLLTISDGDAAWLWDIRSAQSLTGPMRHEGDVRRAVFSPDGRRVATASWNGTVRVWDARAGLPVTGILKLADRIEDIRFSPDGLRLATASDRDAQVLDAATGKPVTGPLRRGQHKVNCVRFSADGQRLATASNDKTARVWNVNSGQRLAEFRHEDRVNCAQFSPDGQWLATASYDGTARIWDSHTGRAVTQPLQHEDSVNWVEFSPDGQRIATSSEDKTVRLWDPRTGRMLRQPLTHADELYQYYSVHFSPDGSLLAAAAGSIAQVWDARTGEPLLAPFKHQGRVNSVRFSPDGQRLVTASYDATARVWDVATGHLLREPLRHSARVQYAEFSADSRAVVTASTDGTAQVWETALAPLPIPDWLPELAEAVAGQRIDERDISTVAPVEGLFRLKQRLGPVGESAGAPDYYAAWARWFFSESDARPLSFGAEFTVADFVQRRIEENTMESLREAVRLSPTNGRALARGRTNASRGTLTQILLNRYNVLRRLGRFAEAQADFLLAREIPARDPKAGPNLINLEQHYNAGFQENWETGPADNNLAALLTGVQTLAGTDFDLRGLIQLKLPSRGYPPAVTNIAVGQECRRLHFLHAAIYAVGTKDGTRIGHYVIHYANGQQHEVPIVVGRDLADWFEQPNEGDKPFVVAWTGENGESRRARKRVRLFKSTWENPLPAVAVRSIDFHATHARAAPFLVAITAEP